MFHYLTIDQVVLNFGAVLTNERAAAANYEVLVGSRERVRYGLNLTPRLWHIK